LPIIIVNGFEGFERRNLAEVRKDEREARGRGILRV
jgi:hypothetical protein